MTDLLPENMELFETHKSTYDALLAESAALRQEEILLAETFSKLPKAVATPEVFELFMRDIHLAHEELNQRLVHLSQDSLERELNASREAQSQLRREMDHLSQKMGKARQELQQSEKQKLAAEKRLEKIQRKLKPLYQDVWEGSETPVPTLKILSDVNDRIKSDVDHIKGDLNGIDAEVGSLLKQNDELDGYRASFADRVRKLRTVIDDALKGSIFKLIHKGDIKECPKLLNELMQGAEDLQKLSDAFRLSLEKLQSHMNEVHENLKHVQEQYKPIRKRIETGSPLRTLLDYLKNI